MANELVVLQGVILIGDKRIPEISDLSTTNFRLDLESGKSRLVYTYGLSSVVPKTTTVPVSPRRTRDDFALYSEQVMNESEWNSPGNRRPQYNIMIMGVASGLRFLSHRAMRLAENGFWLFFK
jgi:hypothetical protein